MRVKFWSDSSEINFREWAEANDVPFEEVAPYTYELTEEAAHEAEHEYGATPAD